MNRKILLDCTFRDGGYYNKWNFDLGLFDDYIKCMSICNVDIVEIGFRFNDKNKFLGEFAQTKEEFINSLTLPKNIKYAVMINAKEFYNKESSIFKKFIRKKKSKISLVRIAINFYEYKNARKIINNLNSLGYEVGLNLMQAHDKTEKELKDLIYDVRSWNLKIDFLYFADSLGCMDAKYINFITNKMINYWNGDIGIHAHNNKSMAFSNTMVSLSAGSKICDSTILGMGRGAGNAQTEFLLQELKGPLNYKQLKLVNDLLIKFKELKERFKWGYNFLYFYAANNKIHPTYIQTFLSEKRYSQIQILEILNKLSSKDLLSFSKSKINDIFFEDQQSIKNLKNNKLPKIKNKKVLIVGNGLSVLDNTIQLKKLLTEKNFTSIFLNKNNYLDNKAYADFTVVVNSFRLLSDLSQYANSQLNLIAPIKKFKENFKVKFKNQKIYNYPVMIKDNYFEVKNNYTILPKELAINYALSLCVKSKVKEIYLIGIDGYQDDEKNHELVESIKVFKNKHKSINIFSISNTLLKSAHINKINLYEQ